MQTVAALVLAAAETLLVSRRPTLCVPYLQLMGGCISYMVNIEFKACKTFPPSTLTRWACPADSAPPLCTTSLASCQNARTLSGTSSRPSSSCLDLEKVEGAAAAGTSAARRPAAVEVEAAVEGAATQYRIVAQKVAECRNHKLTPKNPNLFRRPRVVNVAQFSSD